MNSGAFGSNSGGDGFTAQQPVQGRPPSGDTTTVAFTPTPAANSSYRVVPLDLIDISVFNVPDVSKSVQVPGSGTINLPLLGEMAAAGKT